MVMSQPDVRDARSDFRGGRPLVLCVDDEPKALGAMRRALRREPIDVVTMDDPVVSLAVLGTREVSVLIADQRMPAMSGLALLRTAGDRSPATARVMLTGFADAELIRECERAGIQRLLSKPCSDAALCAAIREVLEAREKADGYLDIN